MASLNPQDIVVSFCEDETNKYDLLYCAKIDSFFYYQKEEGYFKMVTTELEEIIFKYMLYRYKKSISSNLIKDVIKMMKFFVYNKTESNLNDYVALTDLKVLNTKTFEIVDASPKIHAFSKVNCSSKDIENYKEPPKLFKDYLDFVLVGKDNNPDNELIKLAQEMFGYYLMNTLEGGVSFFLVGSGGNGKSVMLNVLKEVIGTSFTSSMTIEDISKTDFAMYGLVGKKVNICNEDESKFVNSAKFKALVTGDTVEVYRKFQTSFTWDPTVKFIFSTNEMPTFTGFNRGLTRRIIIIPFNKEIPDKEKDTGLTRKLLEEINGILPWALEGAKRLVENKFKFSGSVQVQEQLEEFIKNISSTALFLSENYEVADYDFNSSEYLYESYKIWCGKKGKKEVNYYNFVKEAERAMNLLETEGRDSDGKNTKGFRIKLRDNNIEQKLEF